MKFHGKLSGEEARLLEFAEWLQVELRRVVLSADIDHETLTKTEALKLLKRIKKEIEKC